ncbi:NAD(P)H-hydrate dehydratase [Pendulispora albinea]|uniref:Bifunctional NAD(P)H-hydrate repair enzyme n=1 Tax=Pendulispora albinea TaxID=2741071 RepID=A0ABZ2LTF3_9BACT
MIPVLSRAQMRAFDAHAIEVAKVPSIVLMENAGRGAAERILELLGEAPRREPAGAAGAAGANARRAPGAGGAPLAAPDDRRRVVIVCGAGNNGGDGFVVARHLWARGHRPSVFFCGKPDKLSQDARVQRDAWVGLGGAVKVLAQSSDLEVLKAELGHAALVVDALFGTGLDRPIVGTSAEVIALLNAASAPRVALDIPSGLDSDTGVPLGPTFLADWTLTFAHPKLGLLTPSGLRHAGHVEVVGLGIPSDVPDQVGYAAELIEQRDVAQWLSPRAADAHKYSAGHVAVLAGSAGKIGASLLVAHGALRAGAGAATIVTWPDAVDALQARVLEIMTAAIRPESIAASLDAALRSKRAVVLGPGFGFDEAAGSALGHVLATWRGPLVLDADAMTLLSSSRDGSGDPSRGGSREFAKLLDSPSSRILTPHAGELGRLLGTSSDAIEADRFHAATEAARRTGSVVLLKGAHSVIASPTGRMVLNVRGTPALGTAGSGDVLAGIIGALASHLEPLEAACAGAYLHAEAGRVAADGSDRGIVASEIADGVAAVVRGLLRR